MFPCRDRQTPPWSPRPWAAASRTSSGQLTGSASTAASADVMGGGGQGGTTPSQVVPKTPGPWLIPSTPQAPAGLAQKAAAGPPHSCKGQDASGRCLATLHPPHALLSGRVPQPRARFGQGEPSTPASLEQWPEWGSSPNAGSLRLVTTLGCPLRSSLAGQGHPRPSSLQPNPWSL